MRSLFPVLSLLAILGMAAACGDDTAPADAATAPGVPEPGEPAPGEPAAGPASSVSTPLPSPNATAPPTTVTVGPAAPVPPTVPPPLPSTTVLPAYTASIGPVDESARSRMTASWREGCPVALEDLRLLTVGYWDPGGRPRTGELVAHADVAEDLVEVFGRLWDARFPIERMELVDVYDGDDQRSMAANNTSAFNCREIDGRPGTWSNHAYGRAIDINPLVNPWVRGSQVDPPEGAPYVDRSAPVPGMIRDGDAVVLAFAEVGWRWGGHWSSSKDYQHFDKR